MKHLKLFENFSGTNEHLEKNWSDANETLEGYLNAALWSSGEEYDKYDIFDFSEESRETARADVDVFLDKLYHSGLLDELKDADVDDSSIGHDFWLTRCGHGAGFWDRGLGELGDTVTEICKELGEKSLYVGDDGKIYID